MRRLLLTVVLAMSALAVLPASEAPPPPGTHQVKLNGHTFTLPEGFTIEIAAGPPLIDRPIVADFDEQGRLYVAEASGTNDNVQKQLQDRPHRILRLEDTDGDGKFDKRTVFADKMMFPEGAMWYAGSLYVAAPPSIWKLTDTDGDGVADQREKWFKGQTLTGCANDLHGPYLGPDGWIYWCKGAFAKQTYERPGKPPFVTRAAHIFRARPDGSGIEPVMTGGMDNPVELVFTPGGERIFSTTFFQHPGGGKRDGLVHAVYGGVYGKEHNVIDDHPRTSPHLMPVLTHLGPAAPSGLCRYESAVFGREYQDNLFTACFNLRKVTRHILEPVGATFKTTDSDFLVSDNPDFHPTDVLEDADGSLLVIDTGGWYKLCCPTSQLHKPDILGAIYRVRKVGAAKVEDPRGLKLDWKGMGPKESAELLGDPRPAVRKRAVEGLTRWGDSAIPALAGVLREGTSTTARVQAVWAATRVPGEPARGLVRSALGDRDETVRQAALHGVSVWHDDGAVAQVVELIRGPSLHNRRAAAEALGRLRRGGDGLEALGKALEQASDPVLFHSLTFALYQIGDFVALHAKMESIQHPRVRRAILIASDQTPGVSHNPSILFDYLTPPPNLKNLQPPPVAIDQEFAREITALKETAWWIVGRHPEWGGELAGFLRGRFLADKLPQADQDELVRQTARLARSEAIQKLLADMTKEFDYQPRRLAGQAMALSGLKEKEVPAIWVEALTHVLTHDYPAGLPNALPAIRALPLAKQKPADLIKALLRFAENSGTRDHAKLEILASIPGGLTDVPVPLFDFLIGQLRREDHATERSLAASVLAQAALKPDQLLALAEALNKAGPMELEKLLEAFPPTMEERVGLALVAALKGAPARMSLRPDAVRQRLAKQPPAVQKAAEPLLAEIDVDAGKMKERLEHLLKTLPAGDVRRGQAVFRSQKAACGTCHAVGYLGGKVGPDLTVIGRTRTDRDLLEAVLYPSASFVRSYEPYVVATKAGKVYNGLIKEDAPDVLVLVTGADQEVRIPREEIEEMKPSKVSVMPAGLDQQLSPQDLADLVAFLKACR